MKLAERLHRPSSKDPCWWGTNVNSMEVGQMFFDPRLFRSSLLQFGR